MWLSSGEWASVPLLDGVTAASRSKAPRRGRRRVTSAFTLGRISFEKSMKPLRGFFDLGLESFLALAAGLAMVKSAGGAAVREGRATRVWGRGHVGRRWAAVRGTRRRRLAAQFTAVGEHAPHKHRKSSRHRAGISPRRGSVRRVPAARASSRVNRPSDEGVRGRWTLARARNPIREEQSPSLIPGC